MAIISTTSYFQGPYIFSLLFFCDTRNLGEFERPVMDVNRADQNLERNVGQFQGSVAPETNEGSVVKSMSETLSPLRERRGGVDSRKVRQREDVTLTNYPFNMKLNAFCS